LTETNALIPSHAASFYFAFLRNDVTLENDAQEQKRKSLYPLFSRALFDWFMGRHKIILVQYNKKRYVTRGLVQAKTAGIGGASGDCYWEFCELLPTFVAVSFMSLGACMCMSVCVYL